jgi:hypothetical protein
MSDSCLNCGGLIMEQGKVYGYSGPTCHCPKNPAHQYQRPASKEASKVPQETLQMRKSNDISEALKKSVAHLAFELKRDPDYRRSWSANIAMAFKDAYARESRVVNGGLVDMHTVANQAAEDFLNLLCTDSVSVPAQTAEQYTQLLRELDDLLDFLAKEVITLDIVESDKNNGQWPRSDLVKHAREDIAKALQAPTDTERPKCPCGAWYWDEHTMACAIRVSAVATAPAVEKAKYRIRLLEDDNLLLRSRIAEACLHCSPGSVVWEILNPKEESRPVGAKNE